MRHSVLVLLALLAVSLAAPLLAGADATFVDQTQELNLGPYYDPGGSLCVDQTQELNHGPYYDPEGSSCVGKTHELNLGPYCDPEG